MRNFIALFTVVLSCTLTAARAQDSAQNKAAALAGLATDAKRVIDAHYTLDPTVKVSKTGMPLSTKGNWTVGEQQPADCPQTQDTCVRLFYRVPDGDVDCAWTVVLLGDATSGTVLSENDDAARYFIAQVGKSEAMALLTQAQRPMPPSVVELRVTVREDGSVESILPVRGHPRLNGHAIEAVKQWHFNPLLIGARRVRFQFVL